MLLKIQIFLGCYSTCLHQSWAGKALASKLHGYSKMGQWFTLQEIQCSEANVILHNGNVQLCARFQLEVPQQLSISQLP
jgi:hypothetical protein